VLASLADSAAITLVLNAANEGLFDTMARHPALEGMGTTIAGVLLRGDHLLAFNVGDSRIYLHHEGKLTQVSTDDVVGGNMLTQCLGGFSKQKSLVPHVSKVGLHHGMKLLLCSDGLTDLVADKEIEAIIRSNGQDPASELVSAALDEGGLDNVSAVVIDVCVG
jgi:serine/threonine protein phosphatase PrpC